MDRLKLSDGDIIILIGNQEICAHFRYARVDDDLATNDLSEQRTAVLARINSWRKNRRTDIIEDITFADLDDVGAVIHLKPPRRGLLGMAEFPKETRELIEKTCDPIKNWDVAWFKWQGFPGSNTDVL